MRHPKHNSKRLMTFTIQGNDRAGVTLIWYLPFRGRIATGWGPIPQPVGNRGRALATAFSLVGSGGGRWIPDQVRDDGRVKSGMTAGSSPG